MKLIGLAGVSALVVAGSLTMAAAAFLLMEGDSRAGILKPADTATVAKGASIYADQCATCHGVNLEGEPNWQERNSDGTMPAPPHDESGHTWHHDDWLLFKLVKFGLGGVEGLEDVPSTMPAYEGVLSDEEILAVLSYIKSTWPEALRSNHDALNRQIAKGQQ
ncbi:cytochrome c [Rhodobacteraceae bacterium RKSG542]|uniref:c-type cytochrome n=1 Tax=Pseudovibrio flavus TaxID=2529854 RepID=UPI0012BC7EDF|nr:cytochrome c [Pseudovibrio flavus]MTI15967.1 cytochrome c [Pseudovibrio flavus]